MVPQYYEFFCPVKVLSGLKALSNLPFELDQLGVKSALVITDAGVAGAGLIKHVEAAMEGADSKIAFVYDKTPVDSSNHVVNEVADIYRQHQCDCIIAVGGGSSIDTAKGVNIVISQGSDDLMKFQGTDRMTNQPQPFIVIPTTAGTGSEVTAAAVIRNVEQDIKMPFVSQKLFPHVAILDPVMTQTMPAKITAATGMDALTHAVEALYSIQHNPISDAYAHAAIELIFANLETCVDDGKNQEARLAMANGALLAGIAFSNSMVGIVHGLAHSTGGVAHVPHGVANAIFLPFGMEYNRTKATETLAGMTRAMGIKKQYKDNAQAAKAAIKAVIDLNKTLNEKSGMPIRLRDANVKKDQLESIAKATLNDGSSTYNPEDTTFDAALDILKRAY